MLPKMRTIRLFQLLDCLRGRVVPISAEALAGMLRVSVRTIYRDMSTLQAMGAPIRGEAGVGYQIENGYFLPPLRFDPDELEAIVLGLRLAAAKGDPALAEAAGRAAAKISAVAIQGDGWSYARLPLRAVSRRAGAPEAQLALLRLAVRERAILDLDYTDLRGEVSSRIVRPLGLTVFDEVWLLTAWCEVRQDFRNFRVDRIGRVERTGKTFRLEAGRRFEDYLASLS